MTLARSIPTSLSLSLQPHKSLHWQKAARERIGWLHCQPRPRRSTCLLSRNQHWPYCKTLQICLHRCGDWIGHEPSSSHLQYHSSVYFSRSPRAVRSAFWLVRGAPAIDDCLWKHQGIVMKMTEIDWLQNLAKQVSRQSLRSILRLLQAIVKLLLLGWDAVIQSTNPSSYFWQDMWHSNAFSALRAASSISPWSAEFKWQMHQTHLCAYVSTTTSKVLMNLTRHCNQAIHWGIATVISWPWRFPGQPPAL